MVQQENDIKWPEDAVDATNQSGAAIHGGGDIDGFAYSGRLGIGYNYHPVPAHHAESGLRFRLSRRL